MSANIKISHTPLTLFVFIQLNDMIFFLNDEDRQRVLHQLLVQLRYDITHSFVYNVQLFKYEHIYRIR